MPIDEPDEEETIELANRGRGGRKAPSARDEIVGLRRSWLERQRDLHAELPIAAVLRAHEIIVNPGQQGYRQFAADLD